MRESIWIVRFFMVASLVIGASSRDEEYVKSHYLYQGQLFAGHSQFPWVVEIRTWPFDNSSAQEEWSVGNLIAPQYVLTTCNAVATFETLAGVTDRYVLVSKSINNHAVMYSPDYPYHGPKWFINRVETVYKTELKTGKTFPSKMTPHAFCSPRSFKYFWGIIRVSSEPIGPFRLFVNYAPAILDRTELEKQWNLFKSEPSIAGLASAWGRSLSDTFSQGSMVVDYKLKYNVKVVEPDKCHYIFSKLGWSKWNDYLEFDENTYCMSLFDPDNSMGAICDHDRGAPIVYNGRMIGMVMTGAILSECSNLNPMPFVVQSIVEAQLYWTNVERHILSYYITNSTHLFPGLTGFSLSDSPPLHRTTFTILLILSLLLIGHVLHREWF